MKKLGNRTFNGVGFDQLLLVSAKKRSRAYFHDVPSPEEPYSFSIIFVWISFVFPGKQRFGLGLQLAKKGQGCLCVLPVEPAKPGYFAFAFKSHWFAFCQSFGSLYSCFGSSQLCVQHLFATLVRIRGFSSLYLEQTHYDCHSLEGQLVGTLVEGEIHLQLSAPCKFAATIEVGTKFQKRWINPTAIWWERLCS